MHVWKRHRWRTFCTFQQKFPHICESSTKTYTCSTQVSGKLFQYEMRSHVILEHDFTPAYICQDLRRVLLVKLTSLLPISPSPHIRRRAGGELCSEGEGWEPGDGAEGRGAEDADAPPAERSTGARQRQEVRDTSCLIAWSSYHVCHCRLV